MAATNLRERQFALLSRAFSLGLHSHGVVSGSSAVEVGEQWKILVYDNDGRDIISPLMNVGALRQRGITLHLMLHSEREPVPDAPVIYFVRPTNDNIRRIAEDCQRRLYRTTYVFFINRIERSQLELFASLLASTNSTSCISQVADLYLDMISLEPSLFSLNISSGFSSYSAPSLTEGHITTFMSRVASGLLSTLRVMCVVPIIRAPFGGAAEMLARELAKQLRENIAPRGSAQPLFEDCLMHDHARPVLVITERGMDFFPILEHAAHYLSLTNDLLDFRLNRVAIDVVTDKNTGATSRKTYDLNSQSDNFLASYGSSPFPEAITAHERLLIEVSDREKAIRSRPDGGNASAPANLDGKASDLSDAIESLPEILAKKAQLEMHTNIMQAAMTAISNRDIPAFIQADQEALTASSRTFDKPGILALLRDPTKGSFNDKVRLLGIASLYTPDTSKSNLEEFDAAFTEGVSTLTTDPNATSRALAVINFIRQQRSLQSSSSRLGGSHGGSSSSGSHSLSNFLSTASSSANSLLAKATKFFTKFTPYAVTSAVHAIAEGRGVGTEDESFLYLDPREREMGGRPVTGRKFSEAIVFVLGGGSYSEHFNLQQLLAENSTSGSLRQITYGSTEMMSSEAFLRELEEMLTQK